ncbi:MAG: HpcH/HpaI aldolase/citrate lyase family protein [Burkholderiaceae bacterium]
MPEAVAVCDHYAGSQRFFDKAMGLRQRLGNHFDITLDLEDGAALEDVASSVAWVRDALTGQPSATGIGRFGVRIHPLRHPAFDSEIASLLAQPLDSLAYLTLPKPESLSDVQEAIQRIHQICQQNGFRQPPYLDVLIETHGALAEVQQIAALPNVRVLSFGLMDFVSSHGGAISDDAMRSPGQFEHALVRRAKIEIAAACHRYGKTPSHNVSVKYDDAQQTLADAQRARSGFGFARMWSIHPSQIEPILQAFAPSPDQVELAETILQKAAAANWGPIEHKGLLHDMASYRYYQNLVNSFREMP